MTELPVLIPKIDERKTQFQHLRLRPPVAFLPTSTPASIFEDAFRFLLDIIWSRFVVKFNLQEWFDRCFTVQTSLSIGNKEMIGTVIRMVLIIGPFPN